LPCVEGVRETEAAFRKAGRHNLTVHIYPKADHDLNYLEYLMYGKVPQSFKDIFDYIGSAAKGK
jgi:hypothetical protein